MKQLIYISALGALLLSACSTGRQLSSTMEDDIYYVPGERSLLARDVGFVPSVGKNIPPADDSDTSV